MFIDIGCAPVPYCDPVAMPELLPPVESFRPNPAGKALLFEPPMFIAEVWRDSLPVVDCSAVVRFEVCCTRGEAEPCRDDVAMSMGEVRSAMSRLGGDCAKRGKVESPNSGSKSAESRKRLALPPNPSVAFRCHEKLSFSALRWW